MPNNLEQPGKLETDFKVHLEKHESRDPFWQLFDKKNLNIRELGSIVQKAIVSGGESVLGRAYKNLKYTNENLPADLMNMLEAGSKNLLNVTKQAIQKSYAMLKPEAQKFGAERKKYLEMRIRMSIYEIIDLTKRSLEFASEVGDGLAENHNIHMEEREMAKPPEKRKAAKVKVVTVPTENPAEKAFDDPFLGITKKEIGDEVQAPISMSGEYELNRSFSGSVKKEIGNEVQAPIKMPEVYNENSFTGSTKREVRNEVSEVIPMSKELEAMARARGTIPAQETDFTRNTSAPEKDFVSPDGTVIENKADEVISTKRVRDEIPGAKKIADRGSEFFDNN